MTTLAAPMEQQDSVRSLFLLVLGAAMGLYFHELSIFVFVIAAILVGAAQQSLP